MDIWLIVSIAIAAILVLAIALRFVPSPFPRLITAALACWCGALLLVLLWTIFCLVGAPAVAANSSTVHVHWIGTSRTWTAEVAASSALLMICAGGLGASVHTARSLASKTGAANFQIRWAYWYLLTPFIGAAAGFVVTLGVQGGALDSRGSAAGDVQVSLAAFLAFVAGLFARAALERLEKFLPRPTMHAPSITITELTPASLSASSAAATLEIHGTGLEGAEVWLGHEQADTSFAAGVLTAVVKNLPSAAGPVVLTVRSQGSASDTRVLQRS